MKFTIDRNPLLEALQKVQSVVEKKNTVQILGNILCSVKGKELSLCATDLEVGIKVTLPVESPQDGKLTLSAKHFLDIVKELPNKQVSVSKKDNNWIELICGKSKFNVVSLSAEEYPALPAFEEKTYFDAKTATLIDMIDRTEFAVSTDATRYHLNGVYFEHLENSLMRMTATDGHRLSFVDNEVFLKMPELKRGIIVPKKGLSELRKLLSAEESQIGLSFERGYVYANLNGTYLFIRLIDGEYPDYRLVIPKTTDRVVKMDRETFTSALKRVSLLAHEKSKGVKFALQAGLLVITSSNSDVGEAREELEVDYKGDALEIGFNSKYLLDYSTVVEASEIEFHLKDRLSPGILRGAGQKNHTYVIMPMRI
jgi:DNA polymerase III subunit beta